MKYNLNISNFLDSIPRDILPENYLVAPFKEIIEASCFEHLTPQEGSLQILNEGKIQLHNVWADNVDHYPRTGAVAVSSSHKRSDSGSKLSTEPKKRKVTFEESDEMLKKELQKEMNTKIENLKKEHKSNIECLRKEMRNELEDIRNEMNSNIVMQRNKTDRLQNSISVVDFKVEKIEKRTENNSCLLM